MKKWKFRCASENGKVFNWVVTARDSLEACNIGLRRARRMTLSQIEPWSIRISMVI